MLKNYFKIAWRNLKHNKGYAVINITGLAIGLACCLLIVLYIRDELSYDQYHDNKDRIYRVIHGRKEVGGTKGHEQVWANAPVGPALKSDFPEVQQVVQFSGQVSILLKYDDKAFQEDRVFYTDSTAFDVFSWKLVSGDPKTALSAPYSAVLTESTAKKYFGDENPIGKTIEGGATGGRAAPGVYTVTAVMEDVPSNSHFSFDALMSMSSFRQSWPEVFDQWGYADFYTYFMVPDGFDIAQLTSKIPEFLKRHHASDDGKYFIRFEPLQDAYLHSTADRQPGVTGSVQNLYIFTIIGLFILCIACANFMNLATSRSMERAKEVGVRKVVGAGRHNLIGQFMTESLAMVLLAAVLALVMVFALLPLMDAFTGKHFTLAAVFDWRTIAVFMAATAATGMVSASYPAFVLASFKPVIVLKGAFRSTPKGAVLRKGMVVFQFGLSVSLIAGTFIVFSQLNYLQQKKLGFQQEQMLVIDFNYDSTVRNNLEAIKNTFLQEKEVLSASASRTVPGAYFPNAYTEVESPEGAMIGLGPSLYEVDVDFIPHFGIEMAAGRSYSRDFPADTAVSLVINEAAARLWGYPDPKAIIGKRFSQWGKEGQIIGVVKDFNYLSLHRSIEPLALRFEPESSRFITLKVSTSALPETMVKLDQLWSELAPHRPFLYSFLDESFSRQYEADFRFRQLFTVFSGLALFIACLGLLGLATYTAQQRTKEIGVRKVLGASISSIIRLLSFDFVKLVMIAVVIASPVAWWAMNKWLEDFAYKIEIQWWMFALAGLTAVVIALLTVSFQAIRAAVANPVDSLRDE